MYQHFVVAIVHTVSIWEAKERVRLNLTLQLTKVIPVVGSRCSHVSTASRKYKADFPIAIPDCLTTTHRLLHKQREQVDRVPCIHTASGPLQTAPRCTVSTLVPPGGKMFFICHTGVLKCKTPKCRHEANLYLKTTSLEHKITNVDAPVPSSGRLVRLSSEDNRNFGFFSEKDFCILLILFSLYDKCETSFL